MCNFLLNFYTPFDILHLRLLSKQMTRKHTNIELVSNSGFFTLVAYSLKDKYELLSKVKKRSHASCRFAWLLLLFCMLISALSYSIYPFIGINIKSPIYFFIGQSAVNISLSVPVHKIVGVLP